MRIVIVEDEIRIREGIQKLVHKINSDYEVVGEAENGKDGLKLILELKPELVITDIKMPIMDGLEMLEALHHKKFKIKAIVLSAYSEFAYAQQAIKLGVSEYLIKPISLNDFSQSLKNIQVQYEQERKENPQIIGTLENIFSGIIFGGLSIDEDLKYYIENKYNFYENMQFVEILIYLGKLYDAECKKIKREIELLFKEKEEVNYCMIEVPREKMILIIVYGYDKQNELERWFQNHVLLQRRFTLRKNISYGWMSVSGLKGLRAGFHTLSQYMDWNISLGDEVVISYPKVTNIQTSPCPYPIEIENRLKVAICTYDMEKVYQLIYQFNKYFKDGKIYSPKEIKESFVRFLWSIIGICKEIGAIDYQNLEQQKLLETVMGAKNYRELQDTTEELYLNIIPINNKEDSIATSLVVRRAQSMIHEFYNTGITLDEIADKLDITPEYLGTQFRKEIGTNFSGYIKNYRMNKAKKLLIGTQLKLYEIAEKIGYSDPKYFSRVFRECTEQLPLEYRRVHK